MVWFAEAERFDADQLAAMVRRATGGELHTAIAGQGVWLDDTERAIANRELDEEYRRYGARPMKVSDPEFEEIAYLLSTPDEARYGWVSFPNDGVRWSVLTARTPWFGMIAVREKDDIYVRTFKGDHIADVLAAALGERVWKADEQPIKVTRGELIAANEDIVGLTPPSPHARRALRLMDLDTYLIAEFYAEHHHRGETRKRTQIPLRVYGFGDERYDAGCWTLRATIRGKDEDLHLAPADTGDVAQRIEELRRVLD